MTRFHQQPGQAAVPPAPYRAGVQPSSATSSGHQAAGGGIDGDERGAAGHPAGRVHVTFGRESWEAEPLLSPVFFGESGLRLPEWQAQGRTAIVKTGPHRTVYRLDLPCGGFYLKHYKGSDWRSVLRNLALPCRAVIESRAAATVGELGIATIDTAAVGFEAVGPVVTDSYLISREIGETQSLHDLVLQWAGRGGATVQPRRRHQLTVGLGRLAAQLHGNGLLHRDFHAGNVLVSGAPQGGLNLWLIDLHAVSRHHRISWRRIESNLSLLNNFFSPYATRSDRCRFFRAYWNALRELDGALASGITNSLSFGRAARRVDGYCRGAVARAYRRGDRKWVRGNRRLIIDDAPGRNCRGVAELGRPLIASIGENPEILFADATLRYWLRNTDGHRRAAVTIEVHGTPRPCLAEAWNGPAPDWWGRTWRRRSRVQRIWEIGHALLRRNISVPRPLLFVDTENPASQTCEYLVVEQLDGTASLADFVDASHGGAADAGSAIRRTEVAFLLAGQLRRFHDCGFVHEALTADHVRVARHPQRRAVWLVGLDRVRQRRRVSSARRVQELARLNASLPPHASGLSDRLRFLKRYLQSVPSADWKTTWRQVEHEAMQMRASEAGASKTVDRTRLIIRREPRN